MLRHLARKTAGALTASAASTPAFAPYRQMSAAAAGGQVLVHMGGVDSGEIFSVAHKAICKTGGEVKESRSVRLGGRYSQMFLVSNADAQKIDAAVRAVCPLIEHISVVPARQTTKDLKGPYCATSPLVPFVRAMHMELPWKSGIVDEITEFLNVNGVTMTDINEYRAGKDVVLEGFAHLPTGLAEFPQVNESDLLLKLEKLGVKVVQFTKVKGQDPPPGATAQMAA